jgi:hypothetical protein
MPKSKQQKTKVAGELISRSSASAIERVDYWLNFLLSVFKEKPELTEEEIAFWHRDLAPFSPAAIDYAFEAHRRNAIFFPLYGQIIDLCISFEPPKIASQTTCDAICRARHGKGYNEADIKKLCNLMIREMDAGRFVVPEKLLDELDKIRAGGSPEWRRPVLNQE